MIYVHHEGPCCQMQITTSQNLSESIFWSTMVDVRMKKEGATLKIIFQSTIVTQVPKVSVRNHHMSLISNSKKRWRHFHTFPVCILPLNSLKANQDQTHSSRTVDSHKPTEFSDRAWRVCGTNMAQWNWDFGWGVRLSVGWTDHHLSLTAVGAKQWNMIRCICCDWPIVGRERLCLLLHYIHRPVSAMSRKWKCMPENIALHGHFRFVTKKTSIQFVIQKKQSQSHLSKTKKLNHIDPKLNKKKHILQDSSQLFTRPPCYKVLPGSDPDILPALFVSDGDYVFCFMTSTYNVFQLHTIVIT